MGDDASTSGKAATTLLWQDSEPTFGENAPVPRARAAAQNLPEFRPARQTPRSERREGMSAPKSQGETAPTARTPERRPRRQDPDMVFPDFDALVSGGQQEKPSRRRSSGIRDEEVTGRGFDPFAVDTGEPEFPEVSGRKTDRGTSHGERRTTSQSTAPAEPAFGSGNTGSARQRATGRDPLAAERAVRHGQNFGFSDDAHSEKKPLSFAFPTEETARARRQDFEFPEMPGTAKPAEDRSYSRSTGERPTRRRASATPRETTPETARPIVGSPVQDFLEAKSTQWSAGGSHGTAGDARGSDARKVSAGTGFLDLGMPTGGRPAEPKPEEDDPVFDFSTVDLSTLIPDDESQTDAPEKTPDAVVSAPVKTVPDGWSEAPEVEIPEELLAQLAEETAGKPQKEVPAAGADRKSGTSAATTGTTETQSPPTYPEYPPPPKEKDNAAAAAAVGAGVGLGLGLGFAGKRDRRKTAQSPTTPPTPGKTGSSVAGGGSVKPPDPPEKKSADRRTQDKKTSEQKSQDKKTPEKKTPEKKTPEKHTEKPAGSESQKPPGQKTPEYAATGRSRGMPIIGGVPVDPGAGKTTSDKAAETTAATATALRRRRPMMATTGQKLMILALGVALAFVLGILGGVVLSYGSWFTGNPGQTESSDATGDTGNTGDTEHQGGFIVPTDNTDQTDPTESTDQTDSTDSTDTTDSTDSTDTTDSTGETDSTEETDPNGQSPGESRPDDNDPSQPTDPKPTVPKPTDPKPTDPKPTDPKPTEPKPTEPKPTEPKPTEPQPTEPKPTEPKPTEPEPTDPPVEINPEDYFFHDADKRYLTEADYQDLTDWELVLARNEIFARHGRRFATPEIQAYFDSCPWYEGTIDPEDFDISVLNKYERENIRILKAAGDARKEQNTDQDPEQLIADSDKRFLTQEDYQHLDDWELILARNEIFARHGRRFAIPEIQAYFDSLSWYNGTIEPEDFDSSVFNRYELENIRILKEEGEKRDKESGADQDSGYFFPDSDSRYLSKADYIDLSLWELILARNEIYARHGRKFRTPEIQEYFDGCSWYHGTIEPEDFDESVFNDFELQNIRLLKAASDAR